MAAAALTKVNMPQPNVKELAVKALNKINKEDSKDCEKTKSCSNAQVSEGSNDSSIETL